MEAGKMAKTLFIKIADHTKYRKNTVSKGEKICIHNFKKIHIHEPPSGINKNKMQLK